MSEMNARALISDSIDVAATPERVWGIISDLRRMGEWSPQCRRMFVRGGPVGVGTLTVNINRKGLLVWPTRSRVTVFDAPRRLEFTVLENGSSWCYELEPSDGGTHVTECRRAPQGLTRLSVLLQKVFLGGVDSFEGELHAGIGATLARLKAEAEAGS